MIARSIQALSLSSFQPNDAGEIPLFFSLSRLEVRYKNWCLALEHNAFKKYGFEAGILFLINFLRYHGFLVAFDTK